MLQLLQAAADTSSQVAIPVLSNLDNVSWSNKDKLMQQLLDWAMVAGKNVLLAILIFMIGRFVISLINKLVARLLNRQHIESSVQSFVRSLVNLLLMVLLIVTIISTLGIETTSFAAILASGGVAVGLALSGNLQNFAGGLVILIFKPYRVGDYIATQGEEGTVKEIQIFHTILLKADNKLIYMPNGAMSSANVTNFTRQGTRRMEWHYPLPFDAKLALVEKAMRDAIASDSRVLNDPAVSVAVTSFTEGALKMSAYAWVNANDYFATYYAINRALLERFEAQGIEVAVPVSMVKMQQV